MRISFKHQAYQQQAVQAVVDCFQGQPHQAALRHFMEPQPEKGQDFDFDGSAFRNADIQLLPEEVLHNVQVVQGRHVLSESTTLESFSGLTKKGVFDPLPVPERKVLLQATPFHLDIEMETGTGKTYVYIRTIFELNKRYGWSKFVIMVPSVAIREGVYKSFRMMEEHFCEDYYKKPCFFIYNSRRLHEIESFSSGSGIQVMIINIQAFSSKGADNRRIYEEQDSFQSRKPIDVIAVTRPILILDEPQRMEGKATLEALPHFNSLMILRYSATHRRRHNLVYRLDALDAFQQKLVKKIAVRGIHVRGAEGVHPYLYLDSIDTAPHVPPVARLDFEVKLKSGMMKRQTRRVKPGDNLYALSGNLEEYRDRYIVAHIDARFGSIEFVNGVKLEAGDTTGDVSEDMVRRLQIRETVCVHLEKERVLFSQGVKVLSLFFIDEVRKYRDYTQEDTLGDYARIFEEEYQAQRDALLSDMSGFEKKYRIYLERDLVKDIHQGYFSIDKKKKCLVDPTIKRSGEEKGLSDDADAYDLILKDKERLLSLHEPVRFIFSHSALREGWDNPNIFVICTLKQSTNQLSRRQEIGRGLRLAVNQKGERMDDPDTVHDINLLTVVASESYESFVDALQREQKEAVVSRPRQATKEFFTGKKMHHADGQDIRELTSDLARVLERYVVRNGYTDEHDHITLVYREARQKGDLAPLPESLASYAESVFQLIDSVFDDTLLQRPENERKKSRTLHFRKENFAKKEFQALWQYINRKAVYRVSFDSDELIEKAVQSLDDNLSRLVVPLSCYVHSGQQMDYDRFSRASIRLEREKEACDSSVRYDLLGKMSEETQLRRCTVANILMRIRPDVFALFKKNPEAFLTQAVRLVQEENGSLLLEKLVYDPLEERCQVDIFTRN